MPDPVLCGRDVSRETLDKLVAFETLVRTWSPRINLVSPADLDPLWSRHIEDSAQLVALTDSPAAWLDLGSGGGFPGVVVAILLQGAGGPWHMTLVESDRRKCAFLKTVARTLDLPLDIRAERISSLPPFGATTVSARALAPLDDLARFAHRHLSAEGTALFPKGRNWKNELKRAKDKWSFDCDVIQSVTDPEAAILRLRNIQRI